MLSSSITTWDSSHFHSIPTGEEKVMLSCTMLSSLPGHLRMCTQVAPVSPTNTKYGFQTRDHVLPMLLSIPCYALYVYICLPGAAFQQGQRTQDPAHAQSCRPQAKPTACLAVVNSMTLLVPVRPLLCANFMTDSDLLGAARLL